MRDFLANAWKRLVFLGGDIHLTGKPPFFLGVGRRDHMVGYEEILEAIPFIKPGDVGIHRDWGYLSNLAIPGFMKHGWVHLDGDTIVEAISEGVVERSAIYPMCSDYTIILRPKNCVPSDAELAVAKAKSIVGRDYDVNFKFDIEDSIRRFEEELIEGEEHLAVYDQAFSCTEVVSYSWWHKRKDLGIYRQKARGKRVILADTFLNHGWDIVWASKSVTVDAAEKMGLHEEGLAMIEEYRV